MICPLLMEPLSTGVEKGSTPTRRRSRSEESAAAGPATGGRSPPETQKDDRCPRVPMCAEAGPLGCVSTPWGGSPCPRWGRQLSNGAGSKLPGTIETPQEHAPRAACRVTEVACGTGWNTLRKFWQRRNEQLRAGARASSSNKHHPQKRLRNCGVVPTTLTDPDPEKLVTGLCTKSGATRHLIRNLRLRKRETYARTPCTGWKRTWKSAAKPPREMEPARASRGGARQKNKQFARAPWKDNLADDSSSRAGPEGLYFGTRALQLPARPSS